MSNQMDEDVCVDLIGTLKSIKAAMEKRDSEELKELSNHTIHCSSIYQEKNALYIAMITYSISRIIKRNGAQEKHKTEFEDFINSMNNKLGSLIEFLEDRNFDKIDECIKEMFKEISDFDKYFGGYIKDVLDFSRVQKGTKIYEHGLSLSNVAELIGVSKWDLMEKVGEKKELDDKGAPENVKERLERLRKIIEKE